MFHQIVSYLVHYTQNNWTAIGTYLLSGAGIAVVVKFISKFRQWEKSSLKEIAVAVVSGLTALSNWVINNYATSPLASLGNVGPRLFVSAVAMHRLLVNPLFATIEKNIVSTWKDAKAYQQEKAAQAPVPTDSTFI